MFNVSGTSQLTVEDFSTNSEGTYYATARTEIVFGFSKVVDRTQRLCESGMIVNGSCPIISRKTITFQESLDVPATSIPLADVIARYSIYTGRQPWTCLTIAPIGYQHPVWKNIFLYLPIAFIIFAAFTSLLASFATVPEAEHDIFLFTSNYANLPAVLRLKTPGFFDIIHYAQFIVVLGQLSLDYPQFYWLFTANFAWSSLLFPTSWLDRAVQDIFPYKAKLLSLNGNTQDPGVRVVGTGMAKFAHAVDIDINGLFLTCLVFFLIISACCALLCFLVWFTQQVMGYLWPHRFAGQTKKIMNFSLALILVFPLFFLSGYTAIILLRSRPWSVIYSDITLLLRFGSLYNTFSEDQFHFFIVIVVYRTLVGAMTGLFQVSGIAQIIVLIVVEISFYTLHWIKWPYADRTINKHYLVFGTLRLLVIVLSLAFVEGLDVRDQDKQIIACVQIVLHCCTVLIMFILPVKNLVIMLTGTVGDELHDKSFPPPRMALWGRRWKHADEQRISRSATPQNPPTPPVHDPAAGPYALTMNYPPVFDSSTRPRPISALYNSGGYSRRSGSLDEPNRQSMDLAEMRTGYQYTPQLAPQLAPPYYHDGRPDIVR
ncbi:hypothetical protein DFQ29_000291 [Apophysomyces sp. BC1021]|nr:hypothetical protein DFQ29_000291 [Apophysomyces sp. BC1021]